MDDGPKQDDITLVLKPAILQATMTGGWELIFARMMASILAFRPILGGSFVLFAFLLPRFSAYFLVPGSIYGLQRTPGPVPGSARAWSRPWPAGPGPIWAYMGPFGPINWAWDPNNQRKTGE